MMIVGGGKDACADVGRPWRGMGKVWQSARKLKVADGTSLLGCRPLSRDRLLAGWETNKKKMFRQVVASNEKCASNEKVSGGGL